MVSLSGFGAIWVLFGSDGPWLHPGVELHKIHLLGLSVEAESLILGGNALRLIRRARVGSETADKFTPPNSRVEPTSRRYAGPALKRLGQRFRTASRRVQFAPAVR